jgi:alcohol dehydrogenase class IV
MIDLNFEFFTVPKIIFGSERFYEIKTIERQYASNYLIVSGGSSLHKAGKIKELETQLRQVGLSFQHYTGIVNEPGPDTVDKGVELAKDKNCDGVIAIGGGSVIDTGKAIAGLMTNEGSIKDYLEGVGIGRKMVQDPAPLIAIPTTAGTGSEVTKNAVITCPIEKYKKSFRDHRLLPKVALLDPSLTLSLPPYNTATSGMDALTQLIESYVSKKSQPIPEALAIYGIGLVSKSLIKAYSNGQDLKARESMAMASLLSGICLANSGLGAAHGIAAALGCHYGIPHGLACAILLPYVMEYNMEAQLEKFAEIGRILVDKDIDDPRQAAERGIEYIKSISCKMNIPSDLKGFSISPQDLPMLAESSRGSSMSGNPVDMTDEDSINLLEKLI